MTENNSAAEKRTGTAIEHLTFGEKTAKRVAWECWEFTVVRPYQIRVTNASYGFEKEDHAYVVGVEVCGGLEVPAECECPADKYSDDYDCKHKVALATVGGPTVLNAAVEYESPTKETPSEPETMADKLRADGGDRDQQEADEKCGCTSDFPCADCFISGKREFVE